MATKYPSALDDEDLRDISPEKLDQPCQDKHLCQVAREITNWPLLTPFLGIMAPGSGSYQREMACQCASTKPGAFEAMAAQASAEGKGYVSQPPQSVPKSTRGDTS